MSTAIVVMVFNESPVNHCGSVEQDTFAAKESLLQPVLTIRAMRPYLQSIWADFMHECQGGQLPRRQIRQRRYEERFRACYTRGRGFRKLQRQSFQLGLR